MTRRLAIGGPWHGEVHQLADTPAAQWVVQPESDLTGPDFDYHVSDGPVDVPVPEPFLYDLRKINLFGRVVPIMVLSTMHQTTVDEHLRALLLSQLAHNLLSSS